MTLQLVKAVVNVDARQAKAELASTATALKSVATTAKEAAGAATGEAAAVKGVAATATAAAAAVKGLGTANSALTAQQLAVGGATRAVAIDMAKLVGVQAQSKAETDAQVAELIALEQSYRAIEAAVAPAITAEQRLAEVQTQVTAAVKAGLATQEQANVVMTQATAKFAAVERGAVAVAKGGFAAGGGMRMLGQQLSQVVQYGAVTGNYLQGLIIQLPDLALGFGTVAIAASLVATVVLPAIINAFGGGQTAAEAATEANKTYASSFDQLKNDLSAAATLQDDYAAAVQSGNQKIIEAVQREAAVRQKLLALNMLDQSASKKAADIADAAAKKAYEQAQIAVDARKLYIADVQKLSAIDANVDITQQLTDNQTALERETAELQKQKDLYERSSAARELITAQIDANQAKLDATNAVLAQIAAGTVPIASGMNNATVAAAAFVSQLSAALGFAASLQSTINGINFGNIAKAAELAALKGGQSPANAHNAGTVAETRAQLAPLFGSSDGILRALGQGQIGSLTAGLKTGSATDAAIQDLASAWTKAHSTATGGGATASQAKAVKDYIASLQQELDVMQVTDPVQREMIKNRDLLTKATAAQRAEVEQLVASQQRETNLADAMNAFGQASYTALSGMILEGKSAADVMKSLEKAILSAALQALILGEGPLAGLFGTKGSSIFDIIGGAFGGKKADGGMIYGAGGARDDKVLIAASSGEFMVNGRAANANRPLLEYINGGGQLAGFARGGSIGGGAVGAASGGGAGPITLSIAIDARGAQMGVADQIAAKFDELAPRIGQMAVAAVAQARSRGILA